MTLAAIAAVAALTGCSTTQSINPGNLGLVLSQMNQNVNVQLTTPYGNFSGVRTVPGATSSVPVVPLTAAQSAQIAADPLASFLYGFHADTASQHIQWQGIGGTAIIEISMPPADNAPIVTVTNSVTIPVTSQISVTPATK